VASKKPSRPLYEVFLERVIRIDAVQRHREAVTDDDKLPPWVFFSAGCRPKLTSSFLWSLDAPEEDFYGAPPGAPFDLLLNPISPPMQLAWDAAVAAFKEFIKAIKNSELIANGTHPATGVRHDLHPAEWMREGLILNVHNGDLFEGHYIERVRPSSNGDLIEVAQGNVRWSAITLRAVTKRSSPTKRGPSLVDWDLLMTYGVLLKEAGCLPSKRASTTAKLKALAKLLFGVEPDDADLRRLTADIYAGRRKRRKRKR
jgi:hypothetical protein